MLQYERRHPSTYFWFDMIVNNQHKAPKREFDWWRTTFQESIGAIHNVVLVMSPWDKPVPISRAWCLWEMFSAILVQADLDVVIPSAQRQDFKLKITENYEVVLQTIMHIDARHAKAFKAEDRQSILAAIANSPGGFEVVNSCVRDRLRHRYLQACVHVAEEDVAAGKADVDTAKVFWCVGLILSDFGEYDKAIEYRTKSLNIIQTILGENHPETASSYNNLGVVYEKKGDFDNAFVCYLKALRITQATLGENHPSTALSYSNLGGAYDDKGDNDKAIECHSNSLQIRQVTLGEHHPDTARSYNNLGVAYEKKGDYDKAIKFYLKSLKIILYTCAPKECSAFRLALS